MSKVFEVNLTVPNDGASTSKSYTADRDSSMRITCRVTGSSPSGKVVWRQVLDNGAMLEIQPGADGFIVNTKDDNSVSELMVVVLASNNEGEWQCIYQPNGTKANERMSKFSLKINTNLHADLPDWVKCPAELDKDDRGETPRCHNNGICLMNVHDKSASCLCPEQFTGKYCERWVIPHGVTQLESDPTAGYAILGSLLGLCLLAFIGLLVYNHKHMLVMHQHNDADDVLAFGLHKASFSQRSFRRKIRTLKRQGKEMQTIAAPALGDQEKLIESMNYIRVICPHCKKGFEHCLLDNDQMYSDQPDIKVTRPSSDVTTYDNQSTKPAKMSIVSLTIDTSMVRAQGPRSASMPESPSILIPCYDATCQQCKTDLRQVAYPRTAADQLARMHGSDKKKFSTSNDKVVNAYLEQYSKLASRRKELPDDNLAKESELAPAPVGRKLSRDRLLGTSERTAGLIKDGEMRQSVSQPQLDLLNKITIQQHRPIITHTHDSNTPKPNNIREAFFAN